MAAWVSPDDICDLLTAYVRRERAGGYLTTKEKHLRHELQKRATFLFGIVVGGCYCEDCWEQGRSWWPTEDEARA